MTDHRVRDQEKDFHKKLDRFMRDRIEGILKENPNYFNSRVIADDAVPYLFPDENRTRQKEEILCATKNDGNVVAVNKLISAMKKYYKFAFNFCEYLVGSTMDDMAEDLLKGLDIDSLPPIPERITIIRYAQDTQSANPCDAALNSGAKCDNVQNELMHQQERRLNSFQREQSRCRTPPPAYQPSCSTSVAETLSVDQSLQLPNNIQSETTVDSNPSSRMSFANNNASLTGFVGIGENRSTPTSIATLGEQTGIVLAENDVGSKPEDGDGALCSDVHRSEMAISNATSQAAAGGDSSEYFGERLDAMRPSSGSSTAQYHRLPDGQDSKKVIHSETIPKEVTVPQNLVYRIARNGTELKSEAGSLHRMSSVNGRTLSTGGAVMEQPVKDSKAYKAPDSPAHAEAAADESSTLKAFEDSDAVTVLEKTPSDVEGGSEIGGSVTPPLEDTTDLFEVATICLAVVCITTLVIKHIQLFQTD